MSTATMERRRATAAAKNPGDHRAAAVATVKAITERAADIWGGADGMAEYAWCLLDTAASLGEKLVERNEPVVVDHAGGLACYIRDFQAALHGVRALIMELAEKDWSADDEEAMTMIKAAGPQLRDALANLEHQRHWEVDLGNKSAAAPAATAAALVRAEVDENPHFVMDQAIAVFQSAAQEDDTADAIYALRNLAMFCDERVSQALENQHLGSYEEASAALASLLDLMAILPAEKAGDRLFYAAQSLLQMAKTEIDAQWHALEQAAQEASHA